LVDTRQDGLIVGVDVGGTFTDLVLLDPSTGDVRLAKVPSTLDNQAFGVIAALDEAGASPPWTRRGPTSAARASSCTARRPPQTPSLNASWPARGF
jgi:hypothetical protein